MIELVGPSHYAPPRRLTWRALWAIVEYLFTGDHTYLTRAGWIEVVRLKECD